MLAAGGQLVLQRDQLLRLDYWMPDSSALVRERHAIRIAAPADVVYQSLWEADFGGPIARTLLGVRALPRVITSWFAGAGQARPRRRTASELTLHRLLDAGFAQLEAVPNEELVLGLTGRFWTPSGGLVPTHLETFRSGPGSGQAQAAWNFCLTATGRATTELTTETRVRVAEDASTSFRLYWSVVRPFSGLLRRVMLRDVRRATARATTRRR